MQHLQAAERLEPFIDVALFVSKARQRSMTASGHEMNAIARVSFDKHLAIARKCIVAALEAQSSFWSALGDTVPDMSKLMHASVTMNAAIGSAHEAFEQLLRIKAKVGRQSLLHFGTGIVAGTSKSSMHPPPPHPPHAAPLCLAVHRRTAPARRLPAARAPQRYAGGGSQR